MTREDKELLFKDLCGRLPYGIKITDGLHITTLKVRIDTAQATLAQFIHSENLRYYLRPMSSMTEEEKKEYIEYAGYEIEESVNGRHYEYYLKDFCGTPDNPSVNADGIDWLNKKMFDYRGLIEKGLAIEVTKDNNPYKD